MMNHLPEKQSQSYLDLRLLLNIAIQDFAGVVLCLKQGANPNTLEEDYDDYYWSNDSGLPVIFTALGWNRTGEVKMPRDLSILRALLEHGAAIDARGFDGETPLLFALYSCHQEAAAILLEFGADVNLKEDKYGYNALMYAAECEWEPLKPFESIIERTTSIDARDNDGWTALMLAAFIDESANVELLIRRGADPRLVNNEGQTALIIAQQEKSLHSAAHLLQV